MLSSQKQTAFKVNVEGGAKEQSKDKDKEQNEDPYLDPDKDPKILAHKICSIFRGTIEAAKKGVGYLVKFKHGGKNFTVRIMGRNSGQRSEPYYRITNDRTSKNLPLDINGRFSDFLEETHIDISKTSAQDIINIIQEFIKMGGKL